MNKKEIAEIKKLFTNDKCCISKICGCYVDGNKNKITTFRHAFYLSPRKKFLNILLFSEVHFQELSARIF